MDAGRIGGDIAVESLRALGADTVFGLPGQHALGLFEALRRAPDIRLIGARVESNLAFAADGFARARLACRSGGAVPVTPLLVSTGPGALLTLPALQESSAASVPVLGISSQVPVDGLGGARRGYLHELADQQASFRDVVKSVQLVRHTAQLPSALRAAWEAAATPPYGPAWVEIPQDVLLGPASLPPVTSLAAAPREVPPLPELIEAATELLSGARRPVILAGGGVLRSGAQAELRAVATALRAPVLTTFGGKGAFDWDDPLSGRSWLEDGYTTEYLEAADVLLVVGSGLGELSSNYHNLAPGGRLIHIEADVAALGANYSGLGIHADAGQALAALGDRLGDRLGDLLPERPPETRQQADTTEVSVTRLLRDVDSRLAGQRLDRERKLLADVRAALPAGTPSYWDMTILGYWAWSAWNPDGAPIHTAQGTGGLGFGLPAALGAAVHGGPVLAVSGDGAAAYGVAELATAVQYQLDVTWLIVDDGGYGILREYQDAAFGHTTATELARPDFAALARSFGVPATVSNLASIREDLGTALRETGPSVVVLPAHLRMFAPSLPRHGVGAR